MTSARATVGWDVGCHNKELTLMPLADAESRGEVVMSKYLLFVSLAALTALGGVVTAFFGDPRTVTGTVAFRF